MWELVEKHIREKYDLSEKWKIYTLDAANIGYYIVNGAICTKLYQRGPRKGQIKWPNMDKATKQTLTLSKSEHTTWVKEWERRTGICSNCLGEGKEFKGWNITEGHKYRICSKCSGQRYADTTTKNLQHASPKTPKG